MSIFNFQFKKNIKIQIKLSLKYTYLVLVLLLLSNQGKLFAKLNSPTDNIVIIDSLVNDITAKSLNNLKLKINTSEIKSIITQSNLANIKDNIEMAILKNIDLIKQTPEQKILINPTISKLENNAQIIYNFNNFKINYQNIENSDNYFRTIDVDVQISYKSNSQQLVLLEDKIKYQDTISETEINQVENSNFPITQGKKLKEESTFFDDILEPIIITGTIAVTVILLFTIRSN